MKGSRAGRAACAALAAALMLAQPAAAREGECDGLEHWREIAYNYPPMDKYYEFRNCVAWTAWQFELPEELLYSIIYVERGEINGKCSRNRNGTQDCGPAQINDVRLGEIKRFNLTKKVIRSSPCHNIWAMGYLLRREIERANGDIWRGTGNYHYQYSVSRRVHGKYVNLVRQAWRRLVRDTDRNCNG